MLYMQIIAFSAYYLMWSLHANACSFTVLTQCNVCTADKKMTMHKAWVLLSSMSAQLKGVVSVPDRTVALVVGARAFLEQSHQQYIRFKLQERRSQVHSCTATQLLLLSLAYHCSSCMIIA